MVNISLISFDCLSTEECNYRCTYCFEDKKNRNMDFDKLIEYLTENPIISFFPFGGEPLFYFDFVFKLIKFVEKQNIPEDVRKNCLVGLKYVITNGSLIKTNLDKLKQYCFKLQVSLDGCRLAHDKNRVYSNGKGTWRDTVEGLLLAHKNGIETVIHAVQPRNTLKYIFRSLKFLFRLNLYIHGKEEAIKRLSEKLLFFVFEEDYTDADIDLILNQFYKFAKWIFALDPKEFSIYDKKEAFKQFFIKDNMQSCGCGFHVRSVDTDFNIHPCHRFVTKGETMGNLFDLDSVKNLGYYNSLFKLKMKQGLYSPISVKVGDENSKWYYWCPSTNKEISGNPFYQSAKYNYVITEINRFVKQMEKEFAIFD